MDKRAGDVIAGRYELREALGRGGAGVTYKAFDRLREQLVALKLIDANTEQSTIQFRREASISHKIKHRNVLTISDAGAEDGRLFLVSEFFESGSLSDLLQRRATPLTLPHALRIAGDLASGLGAIHHAGLVHRDLKPSNVLLRTNGVAVIADLGLVQSDGSETLTGSGMIVGSPFYMSPEQVRGDAVDARSDVFALGAVVYELLTKRRPFESDNLVTLLSKINSGAATPPHQWNPELPEAVGAVLLLALSKDPAERYPTGAALVEALQEASTAPLDTAPAEFPADVNDAFEEKTTVQRQPQVTPARPRIIDEATSVFEPLVSSDHPTGISIGEASGWLLITNGQRAGDRIPIGGPIVIGRNADADVRIDSYAISRRHAEVRLHDGRCLIHDLGSQNGTFVNGYRISEAQLEGGDRIELGDVTLVFVAGPTADASVEASAERVRRLDEKWEALTAAVAGGDTEGFVDASRELVTGPLREALGYRVDAEVPAYRGVVGFVVSNALLWIRHSRFPILFVDYRRPHPILSDLVKQIELAKVGAYFALVVVVTTDGGEQDVAALRQDLTDSVYRYDFVVLARSHLQDLVKQGTARGLVQVILDQGVDLSGLSPYVTRGPVPEAMFFGREREIKLIMQTTQAYAIVGGRRIGKTSMLMKLNRLFGYDPASEPIYLNCEDKFDLPDFLAGMADALEMDAIADLRALRLALKRLQKKSGRRAICLLDEVDELIARDVEDDSGPHLFATFRAFAFEGLCRFIFSGSRTLNQLGHDPRSPLFNFCDWIKVGMLDSRSVAEIVTKPLEQLGFQLSDPTALVARMVRATGGHPNLVQWLSDRLVTTTSGRRITVSHLERAAADPTYREHLIETTWGDATALERLASLAVKTLEFSRADYEAAMAGLGISDTKTANEALLTLQLFSVIEGSGGRYRFLNEDFVTVVREHLDVEREIERLRHEVEA